MEIEFFVGFAAGFFLGVAFCMILICQYIKDSITEGITEALNHSKDVKKESDDKDNANDWKPKGWKPDYDE